MSDTNKKFVERILEFVDDTRKESTFVHEFEFSCINPDDAKKSILNEIGDEREYNVVLCTLNTKLSTVGAAMAAFERDDIQICYAQASVYNTTGYSTPGDSAYFFDIQNGYIQT